MITKQQLDHCIQNVLFNLNGLCPYKIKYKIQAIFNGHVLEYVVCCDRDNIHMNGYSKYIKSYEVRRW